MMLSLIAAQSETHSIMTSSLFFPHPPPYRLMCPLAPAAHAFLQLSGVCVSGEGPRPSGPKLGQSTFCRCLLKYHVKGHCKIITEMLQGIQSHQLLHLHPRINSRFIKDLLLLILQNLCGMTALVVFNRMVMMMVFFDTDMMGVMVMVVLMLKGMVMVIVVLILIMMLMIMVAMKVFGDCSGADGVILRRIIVL